MMCSSHIDHAHDEVHLQKYDDLIWKSHNSWIAKLRNEDVDEIHRCLEDYVDHAAYDEIVGSLQKRLDNPLDDAKTLLMQFPSVMKDYRNQN